jgi:hypothetical protein
MESWPIGFHHCYYHDEHIVFHKSQSTGATRNYSDMQILKNKKFVCTCSNIVVFSSTGTICIR